MNERIIRFFRCRCLKTRSAFHLLMCIMISFYFQPCMIVGAVDETGMIVQNQADDDRSGINFSKVEKTGMIQQFAVSSSGQIVTCIGASSLNFNIYDTYGYYDYTIYTNITKNDVILQWENSELLIYLHFSGVSDESYRVIRVSGFEEYEVVSQPVNEGTKELWDGLSQNTGELITNDGHYYLHYGNLMYEDSRSGNHYAVTENTSFHPLMLISIPILTAIIWFGVVRKKVKQWEEENHHRS